MNDNTESREVIEGCYQKNKVVLNPIIDWEDEDVWEFIHARNLPYCELYDEGYTRLGCIGCPMNTTNAEELRRYPKFRDNYIRAFQRMIEARKAANLKTVWQTGEDVMRWWLAEDKDKDRPIKGQIEIGEEHE